MDKKFGITHLNAFNYVELLSKRLDAAYATKKLVEIDIEFIAYDKELKERCELALNALQVDIELTGDETGKLLVEGNTRQVFEELLTFVSTYLPEFNKDFHARSKNLN